MAGFRGFTLVEIVVVMAMMGVLSVAVTPPIVEQLAKARDGRRKSDLETITKELANYYDNGECYPKSINNCGKQVTSESEVLMEMPCEPVSGTAYTYIGDGTDCSQWFQIYAKLERKSDTSIDRVKCRDGCGPGCEYNYGVSSPNKALDRCGVEIPPSPRPIFYACSPGGGRYGQCEQYDDPVRSQCPIVFTGDPLCGGSITCSIVSNRCKNSGGKHVPE